MASALGTGGRIVSGVALWDEFVKRGVGRAVRIDDGVASLRPDMLTSNDSSSLLSALAFDAFQLASQSLLLGAEDVGRLALACERGMDLLRAGELAPDYALPVLASSVHTMRQAFDTLANPDESGARTEGVPLEAARYELETLFPIPGTAAAPPQVPDVPASSLVRRDSGGPSATAAPAAVATPAAADADDDRLWVPELDDDMLELFFEEANERIEELSSKLLEIEQRPDDIELLRDIFRDLHTVKGSSAMVGLKPMNALAHAAEDLVGQLREQTRRADGAVIDALLAALDGLRDILGFARNRERIEVVFEPIVNRLRDPNAAVPEVAAAAPTEATDAGAGAEPTAAKGPAPAKKPIARQTIRVDFDKLDRLMNLVGELVLGRDGLRNAIQSLASVATELSSDRHLTRRIVSARRAVANSAGPANDTAVTVAGRVQMRDALNDLGDEINRVERVLVDISQDLDYATGRLDSVSDDLRDQVMKLRMVPVGGVFRKHHRTVRDLSNALGKRAKLVLSGEDTELDKLLVEALDDPLMHLVRNAVDHGVELPEDRVAAGKPPEGTIHLSATHRGNQMVIEIGDDGNGIDPAFLRKRAKERDLLTEEELESFDDDQILDVIFRPGFSTAKQVSEVSGRGVGMDVVRQTIVTRLKGTIDITSVRGEGSSFTLRLPLTLAIIQVLLARTGGEVFAIPLDSVIRTITCDPKKIEWIQDREVIEVRRKQIPLIRVRDVLALDTEPYAGDELLHVVLTEIGGDIFGLACEHLLGKKEIVIKSLGDLLQSVPCAAGATLLGERCAIILDVPAIIGRAMRGSATMSPLPPAGAAASTGASSQPANDGAPRVLLVEDSDTVRESLRRLLVAAGYDVTIATDGVEGLEQAKRQVFDLVSTDVMMPRMDGYDLTRALRAMPTYKDVPIVMVTSKGERIDRVRGFDAGVDEYITKPHDRQLLVRAIRKLLGQKGKGA
jgi:two-component system chemotaxis sensor kinase CheA